MYSSFAGLQLSRMGNWVWCRGRFSEGFGDRSFLLSVLLQFPTSILLFCDDVLPILMPRKYGVFFLCPHLSPGSGLFLASIT